MMSESWRTLSSYWPRMSARILRAAVATLLFIGAGLVVTASPAAAASGNVTVTVTTNQCPRGGRVDRIWFSIDNGGVVNGAPGDTASTWSQLGVRVYITGTAFCKTGWFSGYYKDFYQIPRYFWSAGHHTYI